MGHCSAPRRAALLLGVLVAFGGTEFAEIAASQDSSNEFPTCNEDATDITFDANLDGPVKFSCVAGSALKPDNALSTGDVSFDAECSGSVSFSKVGFTAKLAEAPKGNISEPAQATQYTFTVTKLPSAEQNICYICEASKANQDVSSKADMRLGSTPTPKRNCNVKIRVPADKSATSTAAPSSSTPAPSSSSTSTSSAAAPSSSITTFIGTFSVCVCLVKTYLA